MSDSGSHSDGLKNGEFLRVMTAEVGGPNASGQAAVSPIAAGPTQGPVGSAASGDSAACCAEYPAKRDAATTATASIPIPMPTRDRRTDPTQTGARRPG